MEANMNEIIEKIGGIGPAVIMVAICLNVLLTALSSVLDKIKDLTPSETDNKIANVVKSILGVLQNIIDIISANKKH